MPNCHQEDKISLPAKIHLETLPGGVGAGAWLVGLVWFVGLLYMCYAGRDRL